MPGQPQQRQDTLIRQLQADVAAFSPVSCQVVPSSSGGKAFAAPYSWAQANWDTTGGSMWSAGNPTELLPPNAGIYVVHLRTTISGSITGTNIFFIEFGGASEVVYEGEVTVDNDSRTITPSGFYTLDPDVTNPITCNFVQVSGPDTLNHFISHFTLTKVASV